jgi:Periplasmic copper-binding protein (NosD)
MRRLLVTGATTLLMLAAAASAPAAVDQDHDSAHRHSPNCGETITADTVLHADLRDCPGDGLVIGVDGITLDLRGHTIDGDGISSGDDVGVRDEGHNRVTIRHGAIQEFDQAAHLTGASHNRILRLVATRNGDAEIGRAILLDDGSDWNRIAHNDASANGRSGVAILDSHHNLVAHNRLALNGVAGMGIFGGADNRVVANVVVDNGENAIFWGAGTTGGLVAQNRIVGNPEAGLVMDDAHFATVVNNRLVHNGDNVVVLGNANSLRANLVVDAAGCPEGCGYGVSVEGGRGNHVADNLVLGAAHDGVRVETFVPDELPTADTVVLGNVVKSAGVDGISVGTETANPVENTRIDANQVSRSGDDGIDVHRASTILTANWANHNADLGIFAVAGVIDGGGNRAHGNGNPAQCVGVACP